MKPEKVESARARLVALGLDVDGDGGWVAVSSDRRRHLEARGEAGRRGGGRRGGGRRVVRSRRGRSPEDHVTVMPHGEVQRRRV